MTLDTGEEHGKMFIGGLSWDTTVEKLSEYFSKYGPVVDAAVMKNPETGRSRGFGFVTYSDPACITLVLASGPHVLDGRTIDPKSCNAKGASKVKREAKLVNFPKVFLGGLPSNVNETLLRQFFSKYGNVIDVVIMYDQEKKKSRANGFRGFGFLSFESEESVNNLVSEHYVTINGKKVEVKKAEPRETKVSTVTETVSRATNGSSSSSVILNSALASSGWLPGPSSALNNPTGILSMPSSIQAAAASLIPSTVFPGAIPWPSVALPSAFPGWPATAAPTPSPSSAAGFPVWPFNLGAAQAWTSAVQAFGPLGASSFPSAFGPNYGQTAASNTLVNGSLGAPNMSSPVPATVAAAVGASNSASIPSAVSPIVSNSLTMTGGNPVGAFAQEASNFGATRIYGYTHGLPSFHSLSGNPSDTNFSTSLIPATASSVLRNVTTLQAFHPYRRV